MRAAMREAVELIFLNLARRPQPRRQPRARRERPFIMIAQVPLTAWNLRAAMIHGLLNVYVKVLASFRSKESQIDAEDFFEALIAIR
jgi:hypothetical protein